jgi:hypothetical protein
MAGRVHELDEYSSGIRVAGTPCLNRWGGRTTVELRMKDFQLKEGL